MYSKAMFAKQFKELIDKRGLTQRAVAERINTTETTISRYVSGDRTPNIETAVELASVLGVTLDVLVGADLPAVGRTPPDVSILVACYEKGVYRRPAGFVVAARPLYDPGAAGHHNVHAT